MARVVITQAITRFLDHGDWGETPNGEPCLERSVQGAEKKGPYWYGRARIQDKWYEVTAGATTSGQAPTEWNLIDSDALLAALKEDKKNGD